MTAASEARDQAMKQDDALQWIAVVVQNQCASTAAPTKELGGGEGETGPEDRRHPSAPHLPGVAHLRISAEIVASIYSTRGNYERARD